MKNLLAPILETRLVDHDADVVRHTRRSGTRIDLHCHTTFSDERIRWLPAFVFHPVLRPGELYDLAKARGMDFVTITDHDTMDGCKALLDERGELPDFIVGEELSVSFPEDGTVVHINVYDIDETDHAELQRIRENIYDVVDYLRRHKKLYVLNHMTWSQQHRPLRTWQIEAMLDHFQVFEALNGTRSYAHNAFAVHATAGLGKSLVGGSDSHTNRIGTTYTLTAGATRDEVLRNIVAGDAAPCGAFGTPEQLRDDVWQVIQVNFERNMAQATNVWRRGFCRTLRRFGEFASPLVCLGYHARQNLLIRKSLKAMPA